jgi:ribosome-binding factor A
MAIRQQRIAQLILKDVSEMIQFQIKDPEIGFVTLSDVELSNDYSYVKLFVTFMDKDKGDEQQLIALNSYSRQIRGLLGKKLDLRKIPEVSFHLDPSFEKGQRIDEIIRKIGK